MTSATRLAADDLAHRRALIEAEAMGYSEDAIAIRFADKYADHLRHVAAWGHWYEYDGTRWRQDRVLHAMTLARKECREVSELVRPKAKKPADAIASARTVASVLSLARTDERMAATTDQWDRDPFLLSTPGETIDLRTGCARPPHPHDYLTRQTAIAPGGACRRWREFLKAVTDGDDELMRYLQRLAGYCLTGSTREHILAFLFGPGGNGKGVFMRAIGGSMGDYHTVAPMETFTEARGERHPTDLAGLRGARLVSSQETEKGRRWAESRIKSITGGDPVTARFMRGDFFTYQPEFKLIIAGNHRPAFSSVDEGVRRRLNLVPFERTFSEAEQDVDLGQKLEAEWPGILTWMIEGAVLWQAGGLRPPQRVRDATASYLETEDAFGTWLAECCDLGPTGWSSSADLFASWSTWAQRAGEVIGSQKALAGELQKRGMRPKESGHSKVRGYTGIAVRENSANAYHTR